MEKLFMPPILNSLTQKWKIWAVGQINIFHSPLLTQGNPHWTAA